MAEIAHLRALVTAEQTTTSSTFSSTTATISGGSFVGSAKYLIIASGLIGVDSVDQLGEIRLVHASTVFDGSLSKIEPHQLASSGFFENWGGFWVFDQPGTPETITIEFASTDNTTTVRANVLSIIAIRLDADLVENTDWWYNINSDLGAPDPIGAETIYATKTLTTVTNDDYLVLGHTQISSPSLTGGHATHVRVATTRYTRNVQEGEDSAEFGSYPHYVFYNEASGQSRTFDIAAAGAADHEYSQIFILKLNGVFADYAGFHNAGDVAGTTAYTELAGVEPVLGSTQDVLLLGWAAIDADGFSRNSRSRIQEAGADEVTAGTNYQTQQHDASDEGLFCLSDIQNITAGTKDFDFDAQMNTASGFWQYRNLIALGLELVVVAPTVTPAVISTALVLPAPTVVVPASVAPATIVTSLSVPTPTVSRSVQVDTSPQSFATVRYNGRKILRTSNGTIWVIAIQALDSVPRLRYSTDDGTNWATSSTAFPEAINVKNAAWVFCSDGSIYMLYEVVDGSAIKVRKGTLNGAHTDISWSAATTVNTASNQNYLELAAHEEGGNTIIHVVYADINTLCEYKRAVWGGAFGSVQTFSTWNGVSPPKIEFHHIESDVTAVKDSTPHIYVAWFEDGKIMSRKAVYSSGPSWIWNDARTITSDAKGYFGFSMSFDGTDMVMVVESQGTAEALLVLERNAADTTTTSLANTPTRTGTAIAYTDITYNPSRDIEIFHTDGAANRLQRVTYDRSGSSWGSWVTVDADADDRYPNVKIGYWSGSKDDAVEVIWMDSSPDPDAIMYERFTFIVPATVTPAVIVTTSTLSAPTPSIAATTTPSVVAALSTLSAPTIVVAPIVTPNVIAATSALSTPSIAAAATITPAVIATPATLPTPIIIADPIVATPSVIAITSTLSAPTPSIAATTTPALITTISALPTPTVYWSWTLKAGFDTARFFRLGATQLILVRGISRSAAVGYSAKESWATCSGAFAVPNTREAQVVTAVQAVWAANTGASDAALTLLVNEALNDAGYRKPNGAVIS